MPYHQCPRCGGTDSYGQWEQRFNSENITYKNNQGRVVGSSNGGFGVTNVRQQYCSACVSVKMDLKLTAADWKIIKFLGIGFLCLMAFGAVSQLIIAGASELSNFGSSTTWLSLKSAHPLYFAINLLTIVLLFTGVKIYKKIWIRRQDKMFLRDRFHKPQPPKRVKAVYIWTILMILILNFTYLSY